MWRAPISVKVGLGQYFVFSSVIKMPWVSTGKAIKRHSKKDIKKEFWTRCSVFYCMPLHAQFFFLHNSVLTHSSLHSRRNTTMEGQTFGSRLIKKPQKTGRFSRWLDVSITFTAFHNYCTFKNKWADGKNAVHVHRDINVSAVQIQKVQPSNFLMSMINWFLSFLYFCHVAL